MVYGFLSITHVCEICESYVWKTTSRFFSKGKARRATRPIELVHVDVCESMQTFFS